MDILISLIVALIVFGLIYWAIGLLPIPQPIKNIINVLCILVLVLYLLGFLGGYSPVVHFRR